MTDELEDRLTQVLRDPRWSMSFEGDPVERASAVRGALQRRRTVRRTGAAAIGLVGLVGAGLGGWALSGGPHRAAQISVGPPTSTPNSTGSAPLCRGSQLRVAVIGTTAAAGRAFATFGFTNKSTIACNLSGYPVFGALDPANRPLPLQISHGVDPNSGATNVVTVITLRPGQQAEFIAQWEEVGNPCPAVGAVLIGPPGTAEPNRMAPTFPNLGTFAPCGQPPAVRVSSIQPSGRPANPVPPSAVSPTTTGAPVTGFQPAGASFINPQQGWVLGTRGCETCPALEVTSDAGSHWTALPRPPGQLSLAGHGVSDLYFADQSNGYLFGPGVYVTHDGGHSWSEATLPPVTEVTGGNGYAYAVAETPDGNKASLWRNIIGSTTWSPLSAPTGAYQAPSGYPSGSFRVVAEGATLVLLQQGFGGLGGTTATVGGLWASTDRGSQWIRKPMPCTPAEGGAAVATIAYAHPDAWLVDCYNNEQSSQSQNTQHHLYGTANAGATWQRLADPTHQGAPDQLVDNGSGHAVLTTQGGNGDWLDASLDGARTWSALFASGSADHGWADLQFVDASTGYVVGPAHSAPKHHLYRTNNGGRTWHALTIN